MKFLHTAIDEDFGTIAELNGSLVSVDNESNPEMKEVMDNSTPLYPSIQFEPINAAPADYINVMETQQNQVEVMYSNMKQAIYDNIKGNICNEWEKYRPAVESSTAYKKGREVADSFYNKWIKGPQPTLEHPLFNTPSSSVTATTSSPFKAIAWHPHQCIIALAYADDNIYIYIRPTPSSDWHCQVLSHKLMTHITCLEWKSRAEATLAVGCEKGVCVWTMDKVDPATTKSPTYHTSAFMQYLTFQGQDHVSGLAWDPTPGSHLLASVSATSNTCVVHDLLLNRVYPLKRYGKGNVLLRWSRNGEWLFEGGSSGMCRIWDTKDWTSSLIKTTPGLWVQAACWSSDNRTLLYSMHGQSDVHALFLSGSSINNSIISHRVISTPTTEINTSSGGKAHTGGVICDLAIDPRNGQRLAIIYDDCELIALYSVKHVSPLNLRQETMLFPIGYIRGAKITLVEGSSPALRVSALDRANPGHVSFSPTYKDGTVSATAWNNGTISFVTHTFLTDEEVRKRFM